MYKDGDLALLYRVAKYYYEDKLEQSEIGRLENLSSSQISRLLEKARTHGIVNIEVVMPKAQGYDQLGHALEDLLRLEKVIVLPSSTKKRGDRAQIQMQTIRDVTSVLAPQLPSLLSGSKIVGLGWGRTLYQLSLFLDYNDDFKDIVFVPMAGNSGRRNPYLQTSVIVDRYSEKFFAERIFINLSPQEKEYNLEETESLQVLKGYWSRLDTALIGVGTPPYENFFYSNEFSAIDYTHVCGEILGQGYYSNGDTIWIGIGNSQLAYPLNLLKNIKKVICIACDPTKVASIYWAAVNEFFKTLVTDYQTAEKLLEFYETGPRQP